MAQPASPSRSPEPVRQTKQRVARAGGRLPAYSSVTASVSVSVALPVTASATSALGASAGVISTALVSPSVAVTAVSFNSPVNSVVLVVTTTYR